MQMEASATDEWKQMIIDYSYKKTNLPWTNPPAVTRVRHSDVRELESRYNPILQTYTSPEIERHVKEVENERFIDTLAKNKDRALRYEQTFDVINLENKLKGLEGLPGYPEEKQPDYKRRTLGNNTKADYNIISGLDYIDHHFLPPDQRPPRPEVKPQTYKISAVEYRDFDIVSNRYLQNHEDKARLDKEVYKQEAAELYWQSHEYDPVLAVYVDPDKEAEFLKEREHKSKLHGKDQVEKLPNGVKYSEGALYQPINMRVVDEKRLQEIDLKTKLSKQRYNARYDYEQEIKGKDSEFDQKVEEQTLNRIKHERFMETRYRGYNIINNTGFQGKDAEKLYDPLTKPAPSLWQKTMSQALNPIPETPDVKTEPFSQSGHGFRRGSEPKLSRPLSQVSRGPSDQVSNMSRMSTPASRPIRSSGFRIVS